MKPFRASYYIKGQLIDHYTENAKCYRCGSNIRQRFIATFLMNNTNILCSKIKLLHFAPERTIFSLLKAQQNIEYITCDLNPSSYPGAIELDITDIRFQKETFDAIICIHVLEHVKDDLKAIRELYRVIRPGGWALIAVPIYGEKTFEDPELDYHGREKRYGIGDHLRMYGLDLENRLFDAGFSVNTLSIDDVPGSYIDRSVASPHMESDKYLFFCTK
ncbi:MAG: class I SAM-dependent methyltransferase [Deltaproteobacteria bacterium]|nr:class I SAM-dependent methyltransferase [Deltaproteobacteria bacterium]